MIQRRRLGERKSSGEVESAASAPPATSAPPPDRAAGRGDAGEGTCSRRAHVADAKAAHLDESARSGAPTLAASYAGSKPVAGAAGASPVPAAPTPPTAPTETRAVGAASVASAAVVKTLFLIRHAESTHNAAGDQVRYKGEAAFANAALSDKGKAQAAILQGPVPLLVLSPLRRAVETYAHSRLTVGRLVTMEEVREWTGWGPSCRYEHETGAAEDWPAFQRRVAAAIQKIRAQPEATVAVLCHGGTLAELARQLALPCDRGWANAEVRRFPDVRLPSCSTPR
jgi:broad specificity phosphatase PhoE